MSALLHEHLHASAIPNGAVLDGRYEVLELIGTGGFACVYRGRQRAVNRDVAIKVLNVPPEVAKVGNVEARFRREAEAAAQLHHPNVVTIYDFGVSQGLLYIVMELLEGVSLQDELWRAGGMSPSRVLRLMDPCLEALGMAHQRKVIHKDLKPPNLFLRHARTERESLCILDFGIARIQDDQQLTMANQFTGTPQYFAPEYASLQDATPAVDVYQMGLILVEMWTGKPVIPPVQPVACALLHTQGMLDIPRSLLEGPMGPILARALALDPAQRFQDAHALRKALATVDPARLRPVREGEPTISLKEAAPHLKPYPLQALAAAHATSREDATEVGLPAMPQTDAFERGALSQALDAAKARQASPSAAFAPTEDGLAPLAATQANPATPARLRLGWLVVAAVVSILGVIGAAAVAISMLPDDDAQAQAQPDPTPKGEPDPALKGEPDPTPKAEPDAGALPDPKLVALDPPDAGGRADAGVAQADAGGAPAQADVGGAPAEADADGAAGKGGEEPTQGGDPTPKSGRDKGGKGGRDKGGKADDKAKGDDKPKPDDKPTKPDDKGGGKAMPIIPVDPE